MINAFLNLTVDTSILVGWKSGIKLWGKKLSSDRNMIEVFFNHTFRYFVFNDWIYLGFQKESL